MLRESSQAVAKPSLTHVLSENKGRNSIQCFLYFVTHSDDLLKRKWKKKKSQQQQINLQKLALKKIWGNRRIVIIFFAGAWRDRTPHLNVNGAPAAYGPATARTIAVKFMSWKILLVKRVLMLMTARVKCNTDVDNSSQKSFSSIKKTWTGQTHFTSAQN